jgi:nitroreductase
VELRDLLARRRMVRSFNATPVDLDWLDDLCAQALWAPTAGNSAGVRMHTVGATLVGDYLEVATDHEWRGRSARYAGVQRAGGAVLVTARPQDYFDRYAASDKSASGLDERDKWPLPYWHTDAAMATMALLLLIEEDGWQASLWGSFRNAPQVLEWAGIAHDELFATVLVGRADGNDVASRSLERDVPSRVSRVRRIGGLWT